MILSSKLVFNLKGYTKNEKIILSRQSVPIQEKEVVIFNIKNMHLILEHWKKKQCGIGGHLNNY